MVIDTKTLVAYGESAAIDLASGEYTVVVTGSYKGKFRPLVAIDGTNYAPLAIQLPSAGAFNLRVAACKVKWQLISDGSGDTPNVVASILDM